MDTIDDNDMAVNLINMSLNKDFGDFTRSTRYLLKYFSIQKGYRITSQPQETSRKKGRVRLIRIASCAFSTKANPKKDKGNPNKGSSCHNWQHDWALKRELPLYLEELRANKKKSEHRLQDQVGHKPEVAFAQNWSSISTNPGNLTGLQLNIFLNYQGIRKDMFLVYGGIPDTELDVTGFCDASRQCDKDVRSPSDRVYFVVMRGAVDWKSKKQLPLRCMRHNLIHGCDEKLAMEQFGLGSLLKILE
ncbi:hypothetical protein Tco_1318872 [Tanacetum coccineum]